MFSFQFWMLTEIFIQIGPRAEAKLPAKCSKSHPYGVLEPSNVALDARVFKEDSVLEPSEAALDSFSKKTMSLKIHLRAHA